MDSTLNQADGNEPEGSKVEWTEQGLWIQIHIQSQTPPIVSRDYRKDLTCFSLRCLLCEVGMQQS